MEIIYLQILLIAVLIYSQWQLPLLIPKDPLNVGAEATSLHVRAYSYFIYSDFR